MTDKILIILNPAARGEKAMRVRETVAKLSDRIVIKLTAGPGDAEAFAERAVENGYSTVIAAGGDGTINEVVNGLAMSEVCLGLMPIGTMNVFATELGIPLNNVRKCWDIIEQRNVRAIDLAQADDHYFVQLAGIGLDAQVVKETSRDFKKNFGPLSYLISATQIAARKPPRLRIEADHGEKHEGSFVLIGNGRFYGGPFLIFKNAVIDDGKLDVLIFKNLGYLDIIRYLQGIVFGTHISLPDVAYFQTRRVKVASEQEVPVEVDGEVIGNLPMNFRIANRKLKVIAPMPRPKRR